MQADRRPGFISLNHKKQRLAKKAVLWQQGRDLLCQCGRPRAEIPSSWKPAVPAHRWFLQADAQGSKASLLPQNRYGGFSP
jgi:hypothetical protein